MTRPTPTHPAPAECAANEPPESGVIQRLFCLHHTMMRVGDRIASPDGLTSSRWMVICGVGRCESPPTIAQLSEGLSLSQQNIARMIASMEEEGLVERYPDPKGGRAALIRLTPVGEEARLRTFELRDRFLGPFLEGFTRERREQLEHDLDDLLANLARFEQSLTPDDA